MTKLDKYSPFRHYYSAAKTKAKEKRLEFNLTLDSIYDQWHLQKGKCAISGIEMYLFPCSTSGSRKNSMPHTASLDRIDSHKGYIIGNIQFLCYSINLAKNNFTDKQILGFINDIRSYKN
jgi:hypothetical protein